MPDIQMVVLVLVAFALAGMLKGIVGFGLPTISLAFLAATLGLHQAMALLVVPALVTNIWQAFVGGHARVVLARIWPFLLMAGGTVWIGALALTRVDPGLLSGIFGLVLASYAAMGLCRPRLAVPRRHEPWAGPALGAANGVITGMTGMFLLPGVPYLQGMGLGRDALVQAIGLHVVVMTAALALSLRQGSLLTTDLMLLSALATLPAVAGMAVGQALRRRLSEERFQRVLFVALFLIGLYMAGRSLF